MLSVTLSANSIDFVHKMGLIDVTHSKTPLKQLDCHRPASPPEISCLDDNTYRTQLIRNEIQHCL